MSNLQQINWLQIETTNVPSGSEIDIGTLSTPLDAGYFKNLYISGRSVTDIAAGGYIDDLNLYSASLKTALETTGSNLTIKGNLTVLGTTTSINSTTVNIGDNIIQLNGTSQTNGGLLIKDPTSPNTISGSLLWDTTGDYWKGGPLGFEKKFVLQSGSGLENYIQKSAGDGSIKNSRISDDGVTITLNTSNTGSVFVTGSMRIKGDLMVEGRTILVQTLDPLVETLIVSGAMKIVKNEIMSQIISASLSIQNLGTIGDINGNPIIDCGDGFF
jgi:hypothetical protein